MTKHTQKPADTQPPIRRAAALATALADDQGWEGHYTAVTDGVVWVGLHGPEYAAHRTGDELVMTDDQCEEHEPLMLAASFKIGEVAA